VIGESPAPKEAEMTHGEGSIGAKTSTPVEEYDDPLAAQSCTQATQTCKPHRCRPVSTLLIYIAAVSGEEDEDVKAELKGLKLFVKRGTKEFSTGMLGHIKLLCDKATEEERLGTCPMVILIAESLC
jgi:hypothetical protein